MAAEALQAGNLIAFPTETVYGLGADACNVNAVARIYQAKARPTDHPLIVHLHSVQAMGDWAADIPTYAISLARDFWPGPMTLVLKRSTLAADFVTGGQETVGVRVPNHPVALGLLEAFYNLGGRGVAAPSANRFGRVSPTTARAVSDELSDYLKPEDQILDGGACAVGVESTIIDCTGDGPRILRPGAITAQMIFESTGLRVRGKFADASADLKTNATSDSKSIQDSDLNNKKEIRVSGTLENHYTPAAIIYLDKSPVVGQGYIALSDFKTPNGVVRLSAPRDIDEFARDLYSALRKADDLGIAEVVIRQPEGEGIAIAIRDRLRRASNGR